MFRCTLLSTHLHAPANPIRESRGFKAIALKNWNQGYVLCSEVLFLKTGDLSPILIIQPGILTSPSQSSVSSKETLIQNKVSVKEIFHYNPCLFLLWHFPCLFTCIMSNMPNTCCLVLFILTRCCEENIRRFITIVLI